MTSDLLTTAITLHAAGLAPLPIKPDGSKSPAVKWTDYRDHAPTVDELTRWFTPGGLDSDGIGTVCGTAAGQLEMLEVEGRAVHLAQQLKALMDDNGLGDVWARVAAGWVEISPAGGIHWHYRVEGGPARPNTKLARRPATPAELAEKPGERVKVLIETRGQGGFTVLAPSAGRTHPTGRAWTLLTGSPATCPVLTVDERDSLHAIANMLDEMPAVEAPTPSGTPTVPRQPGDALRPGDDYNARATWDDILGGRGWTKARSFGNGCIGWKRPDKTDPGISGTTGRNAGDNLYVFSTSTEFETETPYSKFAAYTHLEHGGDYTAAARALAKDGFGEPLAISPPQPANPADPFDTGGDRSQRHLAVVDGTSARVIEPLSAGRVAAGHGPTEDGTARALADLHHDSLRYCPQRGMWLHWTGSRWEWDTAETYRENIRAIARDLPENDTWRTYKRRALSSNGVGGIARLAQSDPRLTVHIDHLDANPYELNTPGGIIDLRTGQIRPADPTALHTRTTSVAPDFDRASDLLDRFLHTTFGGNTDLAGYVQRLMGLSAIGTVLEQLLPFAQGAGANGKSTLTEAAMHALGRGDGGYAISAPSEMLMVRKHSEHPAELAQLAGARLVICSELDDGQRFAEARIKQLTGRDSINARFMRRDPFTFTPSHTIWLLGNHRPDATAGGLAFWRRVQLIPFEHVVPEAERDAQLGEKLEADAPAVLAWIARGAADYMTGGLRMPTAVKAATVDYAHDQDTVGRFVDDTCHVVPGSAAISTDVTAVRDAYEAWCRQEGVTAVSARRLTQELRERHQVPSEKGAKGKRVYRGIGLTSATQGDDQGEWYR